MHSIYYPVYIAYLLVIISLIFFSRKKPVQRFSWILMLVLLPVLGLILYLFLGSDSLQRYRKRKLQQKHGAIFNAIEKIISKTGNRHRPAAAGSKAHALQGYSGSRLTGGNDAQIFTNGSAKYDKLFQELREAKDNIHVQYFTIHNDQVGRELIDILIEKAGAGVEVKLLYDSVGCLYTFIHPLLRKLKKAGGRVSNIRPHALDINYRNHRKIVVIDGKVGYAGGMNIGVSYRDGVRNKPWRDTHLRITGSAVHHLQKIFLSDWVAASKAPAASFRNSLPHYFPAPQATGNLGIQIIANGLYDSNSSDVINFSYFYLMSQAKKRVWIQTPYFAPSDLILHTLKALASLGVDVRIMTSSSYVFAGLFHSSITNFFLRYLVDSGVRVFKYDGVMHAKTMLVDDDTVCVGTVNLNSRSLGRDDEIYAHFASSEFASRHQAQFQADLSHCQELDYGKFQNLPLTSRVFESVMSFFSSVS